MDIFAPDRSSNHLLFGRHCNAESPMEDKDDSKGITVVIWSPPKGDNEYFDNTVGCIANLMKLGVKLSSSEIKQSRTYNIQDYINTQKKKKNNDR
jgi:hypothetical protein